MKISNVKFRNIRGDSTTSVAVNLKCSAAVPCENIELHDINLKYIGQGKEATANYTNVKGTAAGLMFPQSCL